MSWVYGTATQQNAWKDYGEAKKQVKNLAPTNADFKVLSPNAKLSAAQARYNKDAYWLRADQAANPKHTHMTQKWVANASRAQGWKGGKRKTRGGRKTRRGRKTRSY